ncbi:MAG: hypothetical protein ACI90V_007085 [Bacillariaceae sp.]|jgi:hypothetical protein
MIIKRILPVSLLQVVAVGRRKLRIQQFLLLIMILCLGCSIILNLLYNNSTNSNDNNDNVILLSPLSLEQQQNRTNGIMKQQQYQHQRPTMAPQNSSHDTIGYIHIGKTGGSTISNLLRNGCNSFSSSGNIPCHPNIPNETIISKLVEYYYHVPDFFRLPTSNHQNYIISIRDPFDRTISSLLYHHPDNVKYYNIKETQKQKYYGPIVYHKCFPTLEIFSSLLTGDTTETNSCNYPYPPSYMEIGNCTEFACAAIHGKIRFFVHLFFNYRNILYTKLPTLTTNTTTSTNSDPKEQQQRQRQIYVIRQEYLENDWSIINKLFGESGVVGIPTATTSFRNISGIKLPVTRDISLEGRNKLCIALKTEYIAYFEILQKAKNINDNDMKKSIQIATSNCPILKF